ncbi:hypothetical protein PF007_g32145, partial [Phytophthora fragariae]
PQTEVRVQRRGEHEAQRERHNVLVRPLADGEGLRADAGLVRRQVGRSFVSSTAKWVAVWCRLRDPSVGRCFWNLGDQML